MPQYGERDYWSNRYRIDSTPFDWMCGYNDQLKTTLQPLLKEALDDTNKSILIAGCGNASFSAELFFDGYHHLVNIDYCDVVIEQQKKRYPTMDWRVMDALSMDFEVMTFDFIIDKSLSDTTLCYHDGAETTKKLFQEFHRVLKPGGRVITISLHSEAEVKLFPQRSVIAEFIVSTGILLNKRNQELSLSMLPGFHTIAVFDKVTGLTDNDKSSLLNKHPILFANAFDLHAEKVSGYDSERCSHKWKREDCKCLDDLLDTFDQVLLDISMLRTED